MPSLRIARSALILGALFVLAAACTTRSSNTVIPTSTTEPSPEPAATNTEESPEIPEHRIGIRNLDGEAAFFDEVTGEAFTPRGVNYAFVPTDSGMTNLVLKVGTYDPQRTRQDFSKLAASGYNTVRVFIDHCSAGPGCIGDADNRGLNPQYLDNLADMMQAAKETGLFLLLTSNDLPDQGGYAEEANMLAGDTFAGYRNSYYLTPNAVNATRRYWRDLLTGLIEREAAFDHVFGWQLLNEQWMFADQPPLSLQEGVVETTTGAYDMADPAQKAKMVSDGLVYYIAQVKEEILRHDPTALVTMGFFAPGVAPGWYVETATLLESSGLDFFDFHAYPGTITIEEHARRFGMIGYEEKPIVLGEYGAFRQTYGEVASAARAVTQWASDSCEFGFDGWLYWSYYPAPLSANDRTWAFSDEEGYFQNLLSPNNHPDPCARIEIASDNLAFGKPAQSSRSLPDEAPAQALDEVETTQWSAGADAPQWIEVDLEGVYRIDEVRLLVAQYPAGGTVHQILVRHTDGTLQAVHEFRQTTQDGDWLTFRPEPGFEDVTALRIYTLQSPSWVAWKEIQVYGEERGS